MPYLLLKNEQYSEIDLQDCARCTLYVWNVNKDGYAYVNKGGMIYLHRYILDAKQGEIVDHINGNPLDNRRSNLRLVTAAQNSMNKKLRSDSKSGKNGVSFNKSRKRWIAYIQYEGKIKYLGAYKEKHEAISVRTKYEQNIFGIYARQEA